MGKAASSTLTTSDTTLKASLAHVCPLPPPLSLLIPRPPPPPSANLSPPAKHPLIHQPQRRSSPVAIGGAAVLAPTKVLCTGWMEAIARRPKWLFPSIVQRKHRLMNMGQWEEEDAIGRRPRKKGSKVRKGREKEVSGDPNVRPSDRESILPLQYLH